MTPDPRTALRVGFVMLLGLAVLLGGIWTLGQNAQLFSPKLRFTTRFRNVAGLQEGSDVRLAGFRIGSIAEISLPPDLSSPLVVVVLQIEKQGGEWIRRDTKARLKTLGLLGDKYIELTQGSPDAPPLEPGSEIAAAQPIELDALLESGENIADNLLVFSSSMRKIGERVERGEGLIGEIVHGSGRTSELADDLRTTIRELREALAAFNRGEGTLALLLGSGRDSRRLADDVRQFASNLRVFTATLNREDSVLGRLLTDPGTGEEVVENLSVISRDLRAFAERLDSSDGVVGRLIDDTELADALFEDIWSAADSVRAITDRISEGDGTIGKLLVDETLYTGLNDILAGAHRGRVTRWVLESSQKRGADERLEAEGEWRKPNGLPR